MNAPVRTVPAKWPTTPSDPLFRTFLNVVSTYRAGLKTGQRRIGIAPVRTYVPAAIEPLISNSYDPRDVFAVKHAIRLICSNSLTLGEAP